MSWKIISALAVALTFLSGAPGPAQSADLRVAPGGSPTMDPQFHNSGANLSVARNVFETRVRAAADRPLSPGLAESWKILVASFRLAP
jgi:ABC-type transport system substrate-binding protein